jgi:nucleotide-binding universal stress UspA family protein
VEAARREILIPVANPMTSESLMKLAVILGQAREKMTLAALSVVPIPSATPLELGQDMLDRQENGRKALLKRVADYAHDRGVPVRRLLRASRGISSGILGVVEARGTVGLILMGWRGQLSTRKVSGSIVKDVIHGAPCDVAVLRDQGFMEADLDRVLVPTGGGPHACLALQLAWDIVQASGGTLTLTRVFPEPEDVCEVELDVLRQMVEDELGCVPEEIVFRLKCRESVADGILEEATESDEEYDLIVIGASEEWFLQDLLFGSIPDQVANNVSCSVLMVRKYEPAPVSWFRRAMKRIGVSE